MVLEKLKADETLHQLASRMGAKASEIVAWNSVCVTLYVYMCIYICIYMHI